MTNIRAQKIANIADDIPLQTVEGREKGELLVLSWGGTYGSCVTAVQRCLQEGLSVGHAHLRYLNPLPKNLEEILNRFDRVLVPELNMGQLRMLIRGRFLKDAVGLNKVKGKPFAVVEIVQKIKSLLAESTK